MSILTQITFRNVPPSAAVQSRVEKIAAGLERFSDRIRRCHVVIEAPHRHHRRGRLYHVRVQLDVPGQDVVVNRESDRDHSHRDVYVAIRDAFAAATRKLEDHVRLLRRETKTHEPCTQGRVTRLFAREGYGFIETSDGNEIYFHQNSVLDHAFARLRSGMQVRLVTREAGSEMGPHASTVSVGTHRRPDGHAR